MTQSTSPGRAAARERRVWHSATVAAGARGRLMLRFPDPSACARCARGEGCGAAHLSRLFTRTGAELPLNSRLGFAPGDTVRVGVDERWLLWAAALTYMVPLLAFMSGALAAHALYPGNDAAALAAGLLVALIAVAVLKSPLGRLSRPRMQVTRVEPEPGGSLESGEHGAHVGCLADADAHSARNGPQVPKNRT